MLLQQWYNLSDVELEEALADRLSFRRFVGLGLEGPTPDHSILSRFRETTLSRFRETLVERGLVQALLDASVVEAQVRRPPHAAGRGARHASDPEAGWTATGATGATGEQRRPSKSVAHASFNQATQSTPRPKSPTTAVT